MVTGRRDRDPQPSSGGIAMPGQPGGFRGTRRSAGRQRPGITGMKGLRGAAGRGAVLSSPRGAPSRPRRSSRTREGAAVPSPRPRRDPAPLPASHPRFQPYPRHLPPSSHSSPGAAGRILREAGRTPQPFPSRPPGVCGQERWEQS